MKNACNLQPIKTWNATRNEFLDQTLTINNINSNIHHPKQKSSNQINQEHEIATQERWRKRKHLLVTMIWSHKTKKMHICRHTYMFTSVNKLSLMDARLEFLQEEIWNCKWDLLIMIIEFRYKFDHQQPQATGRGGSFSFVGVDFGRRSGNGRLSPRRFNKAG